VVAVAEGTAAANGTLMEPSSRELWHRPGTCRKLDRTFDSGAAQRGAAQLGGSVATAEQLHQSAVAVNGLRPCATPIRIDDLSAHVQLIALETIGGIEPRHFGEHAAVLTDESRDIAGVLACPSGPSRVHGSEPTRVSFGS
jgi:hypothetical protein